MRTSERMKGSLAARPWIIVAAGSLLVAGLSACGGGAGDGTGGGGNGSSTSSASGGGAGGEAVPTSGAELFDYLKAGGYLGFPAESAPHASAGPHGGKVRTYVNPSLKASLQAGNAEHPAGAAAVKELHQSSDTVQGWAVMVKTEAASDGGDGWYWYEIYSATDPSSPVADGNGVALCYNCHASGKDYFLSPFPLQ